MKKFILETLLEYKNDPEKCGYDKVKDMCMYLTPDGKKCAVGKHMREGIWQNYGGTVSDLFEKFSPKKVITKKAYEMGLTSYEWGMIQGYHDNLAKNDYEEANFFLSKIETHFGTELNELRLEENVKN